MDSVKSNIATVFRSGAQSCTVDVFDEHAALLCSSSGSSSSSSPVKRWQKKASDCKKRVTWAPDVLDSTSVGSLGAPVVILSAALLHVSACSSFLLPSLRLSSLLPSSCMWLLALVWFLNCCLFVIILR